MRRSGLPLAANALFLLFAAHPLAQQTPLRPPDVPFEPSPQHVVVQLLELAGVRKGDVVYDLGCGDGRIVIAAARLGATGVGIDIDPQRIKESQENANAAGVADRVSFRNEDLFQANISDATVVTLFLWPEVNLKLRPKLLHDLKPGTRVVSYYWSMGEWTPEREIQIEGHSIFLWTIPAKLSGLAGLFSRLHDEANFGSGISRPAVEIQRLPPAAAFARTASRTWSGVP
jgi:SAM-dependent methyltransferase